MNKAPEGTIVFFKKSCRSWEHDTEKAYVISGHHTQRSGLIKALLDSGELVSFGKLTDVPCSQMICGRCKWHGTYEEGKNG